MALLKQNNYCIDRSESERIQIVKLWFVLLVIFVHSDSDSVHFVTGDIVLQIPLWLQWTQFVVSKVIAACAVPGYFFISGLLLFRKEFTWMDNVSKKVKSILVPYLILNAFWIVFYFVAQSIPFLSPYFTNANNYVKNWGVEDYIDAFLGVRTTFPILYPLWFLRDLMVLNLCAPLLKKIIDLFPVTSFCALLYFEFFGVPTKLFFLSQTSLVFFCFGYYFVKYRVRVRDFDRLHPLLVTALYLLCIVWTCFARDDRYHYLANFFGMVTGILFFFRVGAKLPDSGFRRAVLRAAPYSFTIYLFHEMTLTILKKLTVRILPDHAASAFAIYAGIPIVIFFFCLLLGIGMNRYLHRLYTVLNGNRTR